MKLSFFLLYLSSETENILCSIYYSEISFFFTSIFFGSTRFRNTATTNTTATTFAPNTVWMISGKIPQMPASLAEVNPIPNARASDAIVIFLCVKPACAIICTLDSRIFGNEISPPDMITDRSTRPRQIAST